MTIALIGNDYTQQFPLEGYGGIESSVENLAEGLYNEKINFFVICPKRQIKQDYPFDIYETEERPTKISNKNSSYFAYSAAKVLKNLKFDVIWSQSYWSVEPFLQFKKPIICTFQDSCEKEHSWMKNFEKVKYRFISKFHFSNWVKEPWERDKSFFCYTGLSEKEFLLNEQKKDYYLWCAGLNWGLNGKGLDIFIRLSEIFKDKNFLAYGSGNKDLEKYLIEKNKKNSNFLYKGNLARGESHLKTFAEAKAFIMPTRLPEALGRTIIESFSKGTPVFGSKNGSLEELIIDGVNGFKFSFDKLSNLDLNYSFDYKKIFEESKNFHIKNEIKILLEETNSIL
jgi:glycosyltransferase involved in cell wall biosynthesis